MQVDLAGRTALVTGAARGIGRAIADALSQNGAQVAYTDLSLDESQSAARAAPGSHRPDSQQPARGGQPAATARGWKLDVTQPTEVAAVLAEVVREFGGLDILVNNAGVNTLEHRVTIENFPRSEWDRLIDVDLTGVFTASAAAVPYLLGRGGGRIINIASVAGLVPLRLQSAFVAAKAGVVNLTRSMALELGPRGILVNAIAPGSVLTAGTEQLFYGPDGKFKESVAQLLAHIPLGRPGRVEEIAAAALFLAAPESSYINGHTLVVDGGWTAGYLRDF